VSAERSSAPVRLGTGASDVRVEEADAAAPHRDGVVKKGLSAGSVGLLGSVVIGVAAVSPANCASVTIGPAVVAVGKQVPAVLLLGAIPMILVALGYRELNRAMPDAGTSFTWVARAFGPRLGWIAGWVLTVAMAIGFCNAAAAGVDFVYLVLAQIFAVPSLATLSHNLAINLLTCLVILGGCAWVAYRGMTMTQAVQYVLMGTQLIVLILFLIVVFAGGSGADGLPRQPVQLSWFNPLGVVSASGLASGLAIAVFMFWGWEITLSLNEETVGARSTPGLAAWMTVVSTVVLFVLISLACISFAGISSTGLGLTSPAVESNVFVPLARPVFGPFAFLLSLAVLVSTISCVQSVIMCPARTMLAMTVYGALPAVIGRVGRHRTPGVAILVSTLGAWLAYSAVGLVSQNALGDTVTALGIMVCFYLSLTALACVWYFRDQWFASSYAFFMRFLFPLIGGAALGTLFIKMIFDSMDPRYGSGSHLGPFGLVGVIGLGLILLGVIMMFVMNAISPAFFRGQTIWEVDDRCEALGD
jgi:amino acid transporter